jgi:putative transposase
MKEKSYGRIFTTDVMKYAFVSEYAHEHSIGLMCKLLNASRSGYCRFCHHIVSAQEMANVKPLEQIKIVHQASRGLYGSPRVHRDSKIRANPVVIIVWPV